MLDLGVTLPHAANRLATEGGFINASLSTNPALLRLLAQTDVGANEVSQPAPPCPTPPAGIGIS
jgi:hypothetical protein